MDVGKLTSCALVAALGSFVPAAAQQGVMRTFVSGANPGNCNRPAPCKP